MKLVDAKRILAIVEEHEKTNTRPGVIAADLVGERFNVTRPQALSMIIEARKTVNLGGEYSTCPTCNGTGKVVV